MYMSAGKLVVSKTIPLEMPAVLTKALMGGEIIVTEKFDFQGLIIFHNPVRCIDSLIIFTKVSLHNLCFKLSLIFLSF